MLKAKQRHISRAVNKYQEMGSSSRTAGANLSAKCSYTEMWKAKAVFAFSEDGKKTNDVRKTAEMGEGLPKGDLEQGRILYWPTSTFLI